MINKARMIHNAPNYKCIPGSIVGKSTNGYLVKTVDSTVEIFEIEYDGKIKIGDRFND
jgi:methionyl-tRNA formyltransferase